MKKILIIFSLFALCSFTSSTKNFGPQDQNRGLSHLIEKYSIDNTDKNNAHVKGHLVDLKTNEPIPFAKIRINNSTVSNETTSDKRGHFEFSALSEGVYKIHASYIGYVKFTSDSVIFQKGKITILKIGLIPNVNGIIEVKE